jgi:hypothetical protein
VSPRLYLYAAFLLAIAAGGFFLHHSGYVSGVAEQQAITAKHDAAAALAAQQHEQAEQARIAKVAEQYEQDKADAQADYDRNLADLRSGQLRLRKQWTCPRLPSASASTGQPDGEAKQREQDASDLVRIAAEADAQIRGLQAALMAERK